MKWRIFFWYYTLIIDIKSINIPNLSLGQTSLEEAK